MQHRMKCLCQVYRFFQLWVRSVFRKHIFSAVARTLAYSTVDYIFKWVRHNCKQCTTVLLILFCITHGNNDNSVHVIYIMIITMWLQFVLTWLKLLAVHNHRTLFWSIHKIDAKIFVVIIGQYPFVDMACLLQNPFHSTPTIPYGQCTHSI